MSAYFAEVLVCERARLAEVTDGAMLVNWGRSVVEELMTPQSPYVFALRQPCDVRDRADFLDRWRELIAETVDRLLQSGANRDTLCCSTQDPKADVDAQKTAVLILAALYGGSTLAQLARDPRPLNAALDLALLSFATAEDNGLARTGTSRAISKMV